MQEGALEESGELLQDQVSVAGEEGMKILGGHKK